MEKLTLTELGWVCCAINSEVCRLERAEKELPSNLERSFAHLRKEGLESVWDRLDRAYRNFDKRIALENK